LASVLRRAFFKSMAGAYLPSDILKFVEFLAREKNPMLVPTALEAVRHLPVIKDGPLFSVRKHVRANAMRRDVVIKIFKRSLSPGTASGPTEEELERILKEIKILCSKPVALHNNLIDLENIEFGIHSGDPFEICPALVLEKAPHGSLDGFLKKNKSLSWQTKKALCHDIASGLDCLHRHGVLHGDLKPSHVLIFDHPERQYLAKLTGFGDSQIVTRRISADQLTMGGTKPLRAPEIEEGSTTFDQRLNTDIFSVGLLFWSIFVNQDFFESFDLPLDKTFRNNDIMDILKLPYLFRFIPLLIEHEIGMIEEREFQMLQKLFACTVRLSPRSRDLKQALSLLGSGDEQTSTVRKDPHDDIIEPMDSNFDGIKVSVNVLKTLPYLVARQYLKALGALHQDADPGSELIKSATWTKFLCHLYGYGTEHSPQKATEILAICLREEGELANLASLLVPVLREALSIESEAQETETVPEAPKTDASWDGKIGPWIKLGQSPAARPKDHGLTVGVEDAMSLSSKIQEGDNTMAAACGHSNTLLHAFAIFGRLEQIKYLIEQEKVNVNAVNDEGETALLLACRYGNHEIATYLLNHDADASINSKSGDSGLHWLCSIPSEHRGDLSLELVKKGAQLLSDAASEDEKDWTPITPGLEFLRDGRIIGDPLLRAVANRDGRTMRLLLYLFGIIVSTMEPRAQLVLLVTQVLERPIRLACELHLYDIVHILCEEFKRIVLELPEAAIPPPLQDLVSSIQTDSSVIGTIFMAITDSTSPFRAAIDMSFQVHRLCYHREDWKLACKSTLVVLIKYGFITKLLRTDRGLYTILAYAVRCGNDEALNFLLELEPLKTSVDAADNQGYTLVHHAIEARQFNALLALAKNGATLDLRKKKDPNHILSGVEASYLHVLGSTRCDDPAFIQLFLDHGVPATVCDNRGLSALSLALTRGAFTLARTLIDEGASILKEGIFGATPLGELFVPSQANQHDDLFSTFKFLLSYRECGIPVFITRQQHRYTVFHTAAAHYRDDELYPRLVDALFQSFEDRDLLEAPANTPAKSTALQIAIAMYNPIVVKALVDAGVSLHDKDTVDRTPLDYAVGLLCRLVHKTDDGEDKERLDKLDRISTIVLLLSEKAGWPKAIEQFPKLLATFDEAEPLLKEMMCSEHQVAFMRHLERVILALIGEGYADMLHTMLLHHLDLVRRISMKRLQPALRMDLEYRVIPYERFTNPAESFDRVKKEVPWCFSLTNNYLQDFQLAAAFEWLLDLIQRDALPEGQLKNMAEVLKKYAFSGKRSDLKIDPDIVRYPYTLLQWYEKAISDDALVLGEKDKAKIQDFMRILRERKEARTQGKFPLPPFDEEFANLHFDHLYPERLDPRKAIASVLLVTRCRCFFDRIGIFSRFGMTRMCQRMTSIDDDVFSQRLSKMRDDAAEEIDKLCKWKSEVGVPARRTSPLSTMKWIFVDEKFNRTESLLAHPEDVEHRQKKSQLPKQSVIVPVTTIARLTFPYEPLDFDKREIRLLTILPESSQTNGTVCCKMGHFSVAPESYTQEYREYEKSMDKKNVRPTNYHKNWQERNTVKRFVWGDFSCLSYTWGDPNDTRTIMINGHEITVRSNLEAALRSFRQQDEFQSGLMLWTDALCINQDDISEKEKTIRDMQNIYLGAHTVTVWLGAGSSETDAALHTIHDFVARYSKPSEDPADVLHSELLEPPPLWFSSVVYPAIVQLMDRPYWRRLWIMQEITACAPCENIYLGDHRISWRELALLLKFCMSSRNAMELNDEYTETLNNRVLANIKQAYVLTNMAELYRHLPGLGKMNTSVEYANTSSWMYLGGTAEVTDERDRVYGILGLVPDKISSLIQ
jgi:ankyrin repeat protein/serine/threonine protein kinase